MSDWDGDQDDGPGLRFRRRVSLPVGLALMAAMLLLVSCSRRSTRAR